jgi:integrase
MRLSLSGSLEILEVRETASRVDAGRERVGPDTLNVVLKRLKVLDIEHFTVHDMRRTARTHLAVLGVDRFVAER